jgi:D-glycero-alpha-D-manno-heptose 1-phosphate guanylyltransferase
VSGDIPKPMVDLNGRPFLYKLMEQLEGYGCKSITLALGYRADYIISKILEDRPVNCAVNFSIEESSLGTGGAIKLAATHVTGDKFLVLNGDTFSEVDFLSMYKTAYDYNLVISGIRVADASRYGTLSVSCDGQVLGMNEKGSSGPGIVNSGSYIVTKSDIMNFKMDSFSFEEDYIPSLIDSFFAYITQSYFIDIGVPEDYYKACKKIK